MITHPYERIGDNAPSNPGGKCPPPIAVYDFDHVNRRHTRAQTSASSDQTQFATLENDSHEKTMEMKESVSQSSPNGRSDDLSHVTDSSNKQAYESSRMNCGEYNPVLQNTDHGKGDDDGNSGCLSSFLSLFNGRKRKAAKAAQLKEELEKRLWSDPGPFRFKPGELCSLIDPEDFSKLERMGGIDGLLEGLMTSSDNGICIDPAPSSDSSIAETGTIAQRVQVYGANLLPERKSKSLLMLMWLALQDKILILLIIAAIVSLALGLYTDFTPPQEMQPCVHPEPGKRECPAPPVDWVEGVAILVAVIVVDLVGSLNDWQKERQFRVLDAKKESRPITVQRDGKKHLVDIHDVVVGDVVSLDPGEIVAFDGVILRSHNIKCDESSVTGESDMIQKISYQEFLSEKRHGSTNHKSVFMISGSKVLEGVGDFVVTAVGPLSMNGKLMMSLRDEPEDTPLQTKLNQLAEMISKLGSAAGILMFIALMIRFFVRLGRDSHVDGKEYGESFIDILIISVTLVVVAVPEGLPLAVTLALAFATRRMSNRNLLVRILGSCETMANATCICTDKTGTLTQNNMSVVAGCIGSEMPFHDEVKLEAENAKVSENGIGLGSLTNELPSSIRNVLVQSICINSTAFIPRSTDESDHFVTSTIKKPWWARLISRGSPSAALLKAAQGEVSFVGSKTESALLNLVRRMDWADYEQVRKAADVVQVFPFGSKRKGMGVAVRTDTGVRLYVKGASEILLESSTKLVSVAMSKASASQSIEVISMNEKCRQQLSDTITDYASQSFRTLGLCYRDFDVWPPPGIQTNDLGETAYEDVAKDLTFLGVVAIEDPLRRGVTEAVRACGKAGVNVKMCTGDNILTASSIGKQSGIYRPGGVAIEGPVFRQLSHADLVELAPHLHILARSSPEDKKTLTNTLKDLGEIVAVTGDGTNDGPALKSANVGFSMGIAGSEVAKEASDIVLLDDNFSSIVNAIMWGRCVNDAVRKFLQFQITVNIVAVVITFVSSVSDREQNSVLTPVQLLWLNLIMDTLAALALATDPADPKSLERKPDRSTAPLITPEMWKLITVQSIYQIILILVLKYRGMDILNSHSDNIAIDLVHNVELNTLIFNVFVWCQLFNQVNARRLDRHLNIFYNIHKNIWFLAILLFEIGCQILIIFVGGATFNVRRISGRDWGISIVAGLVSWPLGIVTRLIPTKPIEDLMIRLKLMKDSKELPTKMAKTSTESLAAEWNEPAIGEIAKQIGTFSRIRGGRLRASNLVLKSDAKFMRENDVHPQQIMAMVPALVGTSVGGMWKMSKQGATSYDEAQEKVPASVLFQQGKIVFHPDTPSDHPFLLRLQS